MPPVEPGIIQVILIGDGCLVESTVVRMAQLNIFQAFVGGNETIPDDLDLGLVRDGLQIRVENRTLGIKGLAMAVRALGLWVEALRNFILGLGRNVALVPQDEHLMCEQGITENIKIRICWCSTVSYGKKQKKGGLRWEPYQEVTDFTGILLRLKIVIWKHSHKASINHSDLTTQILDIDIGDCRTKVYVRTLRDNEGFNLDLGAHFNKRKAKREKVCWVVRKFVVYGR